MIAIDIDGSVSYNLLLCAKITIMAYISFGRIIPVETISDTYINNPNSGRLCSCIIYQAYKKRT